MDALSLPSAFPFFPAVPAFSSILPEAALTPAPLDSTAPPAFAKLICPELSPSLSFAFRAQKPVVI